MRELECISKEIYAVVNMAENGGSKPPSGLSFGGFKVAPCPL